MAWKSLASIGFPKYEVSSEGFLGGPQGITRGHLFDGRWRVTLRNDEGVITMQLHTLVAQFFVPNEDPVHNKHVSWKDGDPTNCAADNLYWTPNYTFNSRGRW